MNPDEIPPREQMTFSIGRTPYGDGTLKTVFVRARGGAITFDLPDDEMRELAATLLTHLGESFMFPNTLEAEVIRAAGAWLDRAEKPAAGTPSLHKTISGYYNDLRDAVKDYRAGVSTK